MNELYSIRYTLYLFVTLAGVAILYAYFTHPPIEFVADLVIRCLYAFFAVTIYLLILFVIEFGFLLNEKQITEVRSINSSRRPVRKTITGKQKPLYSPYEIQLYRRLVALLYDNESTAQRLLNGTYQRNPSRSFQWVCEKTIDDLIRDRTR